MKLALVLLMSAVGFGQATATSKAVEKVCPSGYHAEKVLHWDPPFGDVYNCEKNKPKPHKPKPSVKPPVGDLDTGPVEMLKPDGCDVAADECWAVHKAAVPVGPQKKCWPSSDGVNETCDIGGGVTTSTLVMVINQDALEGWPPDKAAVPVEPWHVPLFVEGTVPEWSIDCNTAEDRIGCDPHGSVSVHIPTQSVVKLSDSEYSHLQQLRASVVEEEKRLAVKYGASAGEGTCSDDGTICLHDGIKFGKLADHYEFHGQFLLIDKGGK